ncbi:hypothetical protein PAL_GLEAN10018579 [Pteropus alecto]|uniref:Uncharacterized protein n=1 Tax=Pteropus alecto TaxID=9402 RepID=L5JNV1_PTEAL|nr:hypothetical protein PAL_GLEAN10018579 [Pteropus alecto]
MAPTQPSHLRVLPAEPIGLSGAPPNNVLTAQEFYCQPCIPRGETLLYLPLSIVPSTLPDPRTDTRPTEKTLCQICSQQVDSDTVYSLTPL